MRIQTSVVVVVSVLAFGSADVPGDPMDVDYRSLVSRADLHYDKPVSRSEEGIPVGNGRMGSLVWTTPEAIRLQINRVDVFANNSYTTSFPARNSDYCGGCGFVEITFGGDVFTNEKTSQHLSCYDGLAEIRGDGVAANVLAWNEQDVMASSSRGKFPAKFNGMIWTTGGDRRSWGGQYWGANQECLYNTLLATNRMELLDPMFDMYWGMYDSCATAARQQWGSKGIYIPETVAFDGLARLPDDIAAEMRDLYLLEKPWDQRSERFLAVARTGQPHSSRWNWMGGGKYVDGVWQPTERGGGPYGPVTHIFSRGAKIAYTFWQRFEYTLDKTWLRDRAYPMLKGVAEFYRNYPNIKKGEDAKYHVHHVNSNESVQGGHDPDEEIASIMGILPAVIKASEILRVDADMRPVWKEFLDNLAPLPTGGDPPVWIRALPPIFRGRGGGRPDGNTMPQWFFDLCTLENDDPKTMRIANTTLDGYLRGPNTRPGVLSKVGVTAAMMGRADAVRYLLPNQLSFPDRAPILANRLDQREGAQTTNAQRLGRVADALHNALLQSMGPGPAKDPVIRVFPAWPKEWDASFSLLARGAFLVSSSMRGGQIEFVQVASQAGGECRIRNPWLDTTVTLYRDGDKAEELSGSLLRVPTKQAETITFVPAGIVPVKKSIM